MVLSMNAVPRSSRHSSAATVVDPKRRLCLHPRLFGGHAVVDQLRRLALDVELQLVVEIALGALRREQRAGAQCQVAKVHAVTPVSSRG